MLMDYESGLHIVVSDQWSVVSQNGILKIRFIQVFKKKQR
jgi:hypothetical protein